MDGVIQVSSYHRYVANIVGWHGTPGLCCLLVGVWRIYCFINRFLIDRLFNRSCVSYRRSVSSSDLSFVGSVMVSCSLSFSLSSFVSLSLTLSLSLCLWSWFYYEWLLTRSISISWSLSRAKRTLCGCWALKRLFSRRLFTSRYLDLKWFCECLLQSKTQRKQQWEHLTRQLWLVLATLENPISCTFSRDPLIAFSAFFTGQFCLCTVLCLAVCLFVSLCVSVSLFITAAYWMIPDKP